MQYQICLHKQNVTLAYCILYISILFCRPISNMSETPVIHLNSVLDSDIMTTTTTTTFGGHRPQGLLGPELNRKGYEGYDLAGLNHMHLYVGPENVHELRAVHRDSYPSAIFYVSTILGLYVCGLILILIHYMNSSYGRWAWSFSDIWDELR
jgi:hypothetical protein